MALEVGDKLYNIRLSFNKAIANSFKNELGQTGKIKVNYDDDKFDPQNETRWLRIMWIHDDIGITSEFLVQLSCVTRNDRLGLGLAKLTDLVWSMLDEIDYGYQVYDFSNDIQSPIATGRWVRIGTFGPSRPIPTTEAGIREHMMTLRFYYGTNI